MSEFKFACPICGQHISGDSSNSGTQIDCPTCFRPIIIPQAPTLKDTRLIVTAGQPGKPKPYRPIPGPQERPKASRWPAILLVAIVIAAAIAAWLLWRARSGH